MTSVPDFSAESVSEKKTSGQKMMKLLIVLALTFHTIAGQVRYNPCDEVPGGSGFINDFSSCSAYYSCVNFLAFLMECPDTYHYLQTALGEGICHFPAIANCQRCPPIGVRLFQKPNSCTDYTLCVDGVASDRVCAAGMSFSRQLGSCVKSEEINCVHNIPRLP